MKNSEKQFLKLITKFDSVDEEKMIVYNVVASNGDLNRNGESVNPDGWDLKNFKANPIILVDHDYSVEKAVGIAKGVKVVDGELVFKSVEFSQTNPLARLTFNLIKEGILKTVSAGYIVHQWGGENDKYSIMKQELLETSWVVVPANPKAMTKNQIDSLNELKKSIDAIKPKHDEADSEPKEPEEEPVTEPEKHDEPEKLEVTRELFEGMSKRFEAIEQALAEIDSKVDAKISEAIKTLIDTQTNIESDEDALHSQSDSALTVLHDVAQELRELNQASGKALHAFRLLTTSKQKES